MKYDTNVGLGLALSFLGGFSLGLLGIGGGAVVVPILNLVMNFPIHLAVATSIFIMIFTSMSGVIMHFSITGAQLGAHISKRTSGKNPRKMIGIVLFLISLRMIWKYM